MAATTRTKASRSRGADRYMELVRAFPLRPIKSGDAYQQAKRMLRSLANERGRAGDDYKAVLVSLIVEYERNAGHRVDTSKLDAADIVRHLLGERGMSVNTFAKAVNVSQSALNDMLNGQRDWSKAAIVNICDYVGLRPDIFLRAASSAPARIS